MAVYGITFRNDGDTITKTAEFYEINNGFLRLYRRSDGFTDELASYAIDNILQIVLQKEYSAAEVLNQLNKG